MVSVPNKDLSKFAWLSIAAAIITIALKTGAWALTGSVGLLSDAAESIVNLVAAAVILVTSVERFVHPRGIDNVGVGLLISVLASLVNGGVALVLLRAGKEYRSLTLTADARHLMTDVVTSVGVLVGVGLVWLTGWERLDPIVAFAVGVNHRHRGEAHQPVRGGAAGRDSPRRGEPENRGHPAHPHHREHPVPRPADPSLRAGPPRHRACAGAG